MPSALTKFIRPLGTLVLMLVLVSILIFVMLEFAPGDAATQLAGSGASAEEIARVRTELGLDDPAVVRYARWAGGVLQGDLGTSLYSSRTVAGAIGGSIGPTLSLVAISMIIALAVSLPLGIAAALRPRSFLDRAIVVTSTIGVAVPEFVVALLLLTVFSAELGLLPAIGYVSPGESIGDWLRHLILPALALSLPPAAELARQTRAAFRETLSQEFIIALEARGVSRRSILAKHAMRNSLIPVLTVFGTWIGRLVGAAVIVEYVFGIPGFGVLTMDSILRQDIPMIQGIVLFVAAFVTVVNTSVDLSYTYLNPRERSGKGA